MVHDGKPLFAGLRWSSQRVAPHEIDVVRDQHEGATREGAAHPSRGVRDNEDLDAELAEHARWEPGCRGGVPLIKMKASRLHDDRDAFELSRNQLAFMSCHTRLGKTGDRAIRDPDRIDYLIGEKPQSGTQDDCDARLQGAEPLPDDFRCFTNTARLASPARPACLLSLHHHSRIPASVADRKLASVPAIIARKPRRARSCLRSGASAPMPPI